MKAQGEDREARSMSSRERLTAVLTGKVPDRVPYQDAFWRTTVERWQREGLPPKVSPEEYFGCEMAMVGGDYTLRFPVTVLEEAERYRVYTDADGATRQELRTGDGWTPHWLDFAIRGPDDWRRLADRSAYDPSRFNPVAVAAARRAQAAGRFLVFRAHACFHPTWHKIGLENLLMAMIDDPEWIVEMFAAHTRLVIGLYDGLRAQGVTCDAAWLSDDLGFRNAPLISPAMYRELVMPWHGRACARFAQDGLPTILHSDGDVRPLIPSFLEAGFTCLHPLEAKAGLDVAELKARYGSRLICFGNIDVRRLAGTREEIEAEVQTKVTAGMADGGYIFHSDHSVPNDVPFESYRFALEALARHGDYR